jgi:DNA-binding MarR family transcriptional regulator
VNLDEDLGPAVSNRLGYLFKRAQVVLNGLHEEHLAPFGINAGELAVLLLIDAREPESQQQMAQRLGIDRTTMVGVIDALEGRGLVERHPDAADRRRNVIELTSSGRTTLRRATRASDQAEQRLLAELTQDEATQLRLLLRRIATGPARDG